MNTSSAIIPHLIDKVFVNYEVNKLCIAHPNLLNLLLIAIFFMAVAVTAKKENSGPKDLLNILHTDQLRGLGIFFVVLGHLWIHVSKTKAQIVLSGDAVSLFLLLSGFGLTMSSKNKKLKFKEFCLKRINRVMLPYWIATSLILLLNFLILNKTLPLNNLLLTIIGINTSVELRHLDYARWFVTFILLWYFLFFIFIIKFQNKFSQIIFIVIATILLPLNYYIFHFGWYQFISFPIGCLLAIHYDKLQTIYRENKFIIISSIIGILYVISYKIFMNYDFIHAIVTNAIPNILLAYLDEVNSVLISISTIFIFGKVTESGFNSKALLFFGKYSYEIFLLHGVFLIKYNPLIRSLGGLTLIVQFYVLLLFVSVISLLIYKAHTSLHANKTT
jgi:membrane-bound acyltransferase YfiQ involved in biofilm formation